MKKIICLCSLVCFAAAAEVVTLFNGVNVVNARGQIKAVECVTVEAAQPVTISNLVSVVEMTNAYKTVVSSRVRYSFTLTNWYGVASVATNVWDRYNARDFMPGGTNHLVGGVTEAWIPFTNSVFVSQLPKAVHTAASSVWSGTASGHFVQAAVESKYLFGGDLLVTCGTNDLVRLIVE